MPTKLESLSDDTRDELAALALKLSGNQKTRKGFLGLVKEAQPDTPIPEIDEVKALEAALAKRDEAIGALAKKFDDQTFAQSLAAKKNEARAKFDLSDADMTKMEEMMKKSELPADYNWAAQLYKNQVESATPTNYGTGGVGPFDLQENAKAFEGLMEDTDNWSARTAHKMIDEMRKGKASSF